MEPLKMRRKRSWIAVGVAAVAALAVTPAALAATGEDLAGGPVVSVEAVPGDGLVRIQWSSDASDVAVESTQVLRDGVDVAGQGPADSGDLPPELSEWTFANLADRTYQFTVTVTYADESVGTATIEASPADGDTDPGGGPVADEPVTVTASPSDSEVTITWTFADPEIEDRIESQRASRDGSDTTGYGPWTSEPLDPTVRTWTFDKLVPGAEAYTFTVEATLADGSTLTGTVSAEAGVPDGTEPPPGGDDPSPDPSVPPSQDPPASGDGGSASGMPWSSGSWNASSGNGAAITAYDNAARGGVRSDNVLVYTVRDSMSAQDNGGYITSSLPSDFDPASQDLVLAVTTTTSDGASMTAGDASAIGATACGIDSDVIVRLDWEMNLRTGPGVNGSELNAGNYDSWVSRFRVASEAMKEACPGLRIDFNPNHGADQTDGCGGSDPARWCTRRAFQELKDVVDFFGIDTYDSYPPVTSDSGWNYRLTTAGELQESLDYALANGKRFTVPEWGVACNGGGCQWSGNAGGDNPTYIDRMMDFFADNAASMGYETYFSEPDSYIVSDLVGNNPASRAAMVAKVAEYAS